MTPEEKAKQVIESSRFGGLSKGTNVTLIVDEKPVKSFKVE